MRRNVVVNNCFVQRKQTCFILTRIIDEKKPSSKDFNCLQNFERGLLKKSEKYNLYDFLIELEII